MSKNSVIEFVPSKKYSSQTKKAPAKPTKPRRKRKKPDPLAALDPKNKTHTGQQTARTFEVLTIFALGDGVAEYRWRIRTNGSALERQVHKVGTKEFRECYFGLVSAQDKKGKWSPFNWGHVPIDMASAVRELDDNEVIVKEVKPDGA